MMMEVSSHIPSKLLGLKTSISGQIFMILECMQLIVETDNKLPEITIFTEEKP